MVYKKNKNMLKNDNAITINLNDNLIDMIDKIASYHQRKPAELLRLLLTPVLINEYTKIQSAIHPENNEPIKQAIFKGDI